jgi:hypothetical protein
VDEVEARYLLETASAQYWCDDYLIRMFGVECFLADEGCSDHFIIYEPVTAIHDFAPKLATLAAFAKMKKKELKKAHKSFKDGANAQNEPPKQNVPTVDCY